MQESLEPIKAELNKIPKSNQKIVFRLFRANWAPFGHKDRMSEPYDNPNTPILKVVKSPNDPKLWKNEVINFAKGQYYVEYDGYWFAKADAKVTLEFIPAETTNNRMLLEERCRSIKDDINREDEKIKLASKRIDGIIDPTNVDIHSEIERLDGERNPIQKDLEALKKSHKDLIEQLAQQESDLVTLESVFRHEDFLELQKRYDRFQDFLGGELKYPKSKL